MSDAKNVLMVTNSASEIEISEVRSAFTQANSKALSIRLRLVHVIPSLPACYFNMPSMVRLAEHYYEEATRSLSAVGTALGVGKKDQWLITGKIRPEVLRLATRLETHFILAGKECIQELRQSFLLQNRSRLTPVQGIHTLPQMLTGLS